MFHVEHIRDVISPTLRQAVEQEAPFEMLPVPLRTTGCTVGPEALFWARHIPAYRKGVQTMNDNFDLPLELYRDTRTGDVFVWAPHEGEGCPIHLRFLDSVPGDPEGILTYDVRTFLRLVAMGVLESVPYHVICDS